ncbi:hypothetical protein [Aquimarina longa]|uniref:hypothetical protein n=1 Tax=Aquimarina longa TaxID=1080221 RepID=UPI000785C4DA|nr:hypothetical protein [Aquimarina longa]
MKKLILKLSVVIVILLVSCKNEAKPETSSSSDKTEKAETPRSSKSASNVPSFSDDKVQEYVNAYEAYIEEYKKAVERKDMNAFVALGKKGQELGQKAQEVMGNLSGDDVQKLSTYMQDKSTQLQELSQKLSQ